jgi:hypothetical protein
MTVGCDGVQVQGPAALAKINIDRRGARRRLIGPLVPRSFQSGHGLADAPSTSLALDARRATLFSCSFPCD